MGAGTAKCARPHEGTENYRVMGDEQARLARWRAAVAEPSGPPAGATLAAVRAALADDLDTPAALDAIDEWVAAQQDSGDDAPDDDRAAPELIRRTADAILGLDLST
jgi:L-cysteine:1D-myo-inositol 2-amino-2-deoxy-alpha-D-glucopyranoside ligase